MAFVLAAFLAAKPVRAAVSAYSTIEAESCDQNESKGVSSSWENGGDVVSLGWIDSGDYACYKNVTFGYGVGKMTLRYSKKITANVDIKVLLDKPNGGTQLGDITLSSRTGSAWTDFHTITVTMKKEVSGTHDVYLKFSSLATREQLMHIDWFRFAPSDSADTSLPPVGITLEDSNGVKYKVLKGQKTLEVVSIPKDLKIWDSGDTLTLNNGSILARLKVTKVASNAAKNCKKLQVVYFGQYITTVSKNAFKGCTKLNTIIFRGTAAKKNVSAAAFHDVKKKAAIYVPPQNMSYFKKLFKADKKTKAKSFRFYKYAAVG